MNNLYQSREYVVIGNTKIKQQTSTSRVEDKILSISKSGITAVANRIVQTPPSQRISAGGVVRDGDDKQDTAICCCSDNLSLLHLGHSPLLRAHTHTHTLSDSWLDNSEEVGCIKPSLSH
jgi:hypothetical protein